MTPTFRDFRWAVALALLAAVSLAAPRGARAERYSLEGRRIGLYNLAGTLRVMPGDGPGVEVEVTRGGRDGGEIRVEQGRIGDRWTLRVRYPGRRVVYPAMGRGSSVAADVNENGTFRHGGPLPWSGRRVTVAGSGSGLEAWADVVIRVPRGADLEVRQLAGSATAENVDCNLRVENSAGPASAFGLRGDLVLDTGSGRVEVRDVEGEVTIDTGSGAVTIGNVRGPRLGADTGSGGVTVQDAVVEELRVDTGSGGVSARGVRSRSVAIDSGSGHVELALAGDCESLVVDTGSGGVTLRVPEAFGARYEVQTGSGGIEIAVPHETRHADHGEERGRIGDGRGRVTIDTGSGGVRILRAR